MTDKEEVAEAIGRVLGAGLAAVADIAIGSAAVMFFWNRSVVDLFDTPAMTYRNAIGLVVLVWVFRVFATASSPFSRR